MADFPCTYATVTIAQQKSSKAGEHNRIATLHTFLSVFFLLLVEKPSWDYYQAPAIIIAEAAGSTKKLSALHFNFRGSPSNIKVIHHLTMFSFSNRPFRLLLRKHFKRLSHTRSLNMPLLFKPVIFKYSK